MSQLRDDWAFEYAAKELANAAKRKSAHHAARQKFWSEAKDKVMAEVRASGIEVDEGVDVGNMVSNCARGPRVLVRSDLQDKLTDCQSKIQEHNFKAGEYDGWVQVLTAAGEKRLQLTADDYLFFFGSEAMGKRMRVWSATELDFLRANHRQFSGAAIARELGRSRNSVYHRAHMLGLRAKCWHWTKERVAIFQQHYAAGLNDREISVAMRCRHKAVSALRHDKLQLPGNGHTANSSRLHSARMALTASKWGCQSLAQVAKVHWRRKAVTAGLPSGICSRRQLDVFVAFQKHGSMSRRQVADHTGLAYSYANDVLCSLVKLNLLERVRYTSWRGRPYYFYKLVTQK